MPATTSEALEIVDRTVSIAPLVLLSVADHYERSAKGTKKRVVGVLLGQNDSKGIRVSNSFGGMFQYGFQAVQKLHELRSCLADPSC